MIKISKKKCNCGCENFGYIFSNGKLKSCWLKLNSKPIKKISEKKYAEKKIEKLQTQKLHQWFTEVWDKTENSEGYCFCFETGTPMHRSRFRNNTCCYHHPLEKSKFKIFAMEEWNILILLPEIHSQIHSNIDKTPRVKKYTNELKEKYSSWQSKNIQS